MTSMMVKITRQSHPKLWWHIDKFLDELLDETNYDKGDFGKVAGEDAYMVADVKDGEVDSHETQLAKMTDAEAVLLTKDDKEAVGAIEEKYHLQDFTIWMQDLVDGWGVSQSIWDATTKQRMDKEMRDFEAMVEKSDKLLGFHNEFLQDIFDGKKTQTRRPRAKGFSVGDHVVLVARFGLSPANQDNTPAILKITGVRIERLDAISDADVAKEGFRTRAEFMKKFMTIYNQSAIERRDYERVVDIKPSDHVYVFDFELVQISPTWQGYKYERAT